MPVLNEGEVFEISYFRLTGNTRFYHTTRHGYRQNFQLSTTVRSCESVLIPLYGLNLVPFKENIAD